MTSIIIGWYLVGKYSVMCAASIQGVAPPDQGRTRNFCASTPLIHILQRCDTAGITFNPSKLVFAEPSVSYCGYDVTSSGYTANQRKANAIAELSRQPA